MTRVVWCICAILIAAVAACSSASPGEGTRARSSAATIESASWTTAPSLAIEGPFAYYHAASYDSARARVVMPGAEWDGSGWRLQTSTQPPGRSGFTMAFDAARGRTILFGGRAGLTTLADTWEHDGSTWTQVAPTTSPPARQFHSMSYDSERNVTVLFGGIDASNARFSDTWEYDGTTWTQRTPAFSPPGNAGDSAPMAYDPFTHRTTYVSSWNSGTYEWDGTNWAFHPTALLPAAGTNAALVYDPVRSRLVLFGGFFNGDRSDRTYEWDGTNWTLVSTATSPSARFGMAYAFDTQTSTMVIQGGNTATGTVNETWEYTGTTWRRRPANPSGRVAHALAFDAARGNTVLLGGQSTLSGGSTLDETWLFDGVRWTQRFPAVSPGARAWYGATYDAKRARVVVFGGLRGTTRLGDTWEWDGATWSERTTATSPAPRVACQLAYDSARERVVLFGGVKDSPTDDAGTWEYDGTDWSLKTSPNLPAPTRDGLMLAYDEARQRTLLFSGIVPGVANDNRTWEWDGTNWTERLPMASPSGRTYAQMTYDRSRQRMVFFGGFTSSGVAGDTWEWNGTNWLAVTPTTVPPARMLHGSAYDSARRQTVMFGGAPTVGGAPLAETWLYVNGGALGSDCSLGTQCLSGFCVDGVCCNGSCTQTCNACNLAGSVGTCAPMTVCGGPTVTTNQSSYNPADAIIASHTFLAGTSTDWIAIARSGSADNVYERWSYTTGAPSGSVTLAGGLVPGSYVARAFNTNSFVKVAESAPFTITGVVPVTAIATDKAIYAPSESALVTFANMSGNGGDWIAIAPLGSPPTTFSLWSYVATTDGARSFALSTLPEGDYVARAFFQNTFVVEATSAPFHVNAATGVSITTTQPTYNLGEPIVASFTGLSGSGSDWIALARPSDPPTTYLAWTYTAGGTSGSATFASAPIGTYVVRAFNANGFTIAAESAPFSVTGTLAIPIVTTNATSYQEGTSVMLSFSGLPGNTNDWVALSLQGSPATSFAVWIYTGGAMAGTATFTAPVTGTYVARAYVDNTFNVIAESAPFIIGPVVTTAADSGPGSLREAAANVPANGMITFAPSLNGQTLTVLSQILLLRPMTIQGPGSAQFTIDGGGTIQPIAGPNGTVVRGLTFRNGRCESDNGAGTGGGAMRLGAATLEDLVFIGNRCVHVTFGNGGALHLNGPTSLTNIVFEDNRASYYGGAVVTSGFAPLTMQDVRFYGNSAPNGAGVAFTGSVTSSIRNAVFIRQTQGAAIFSQGQIVAIDNAVMIENTVATQTLNGILDVRNAAFSDNPFVFLTPNVNISYSSFSNNGPNPFQGLPDPTGSDGNFNAAPMFVDTSAPNPRVWDLHLQVGSPLRDQGAPSLLDPDTTRSDIGYHGGPNAPP